MINKNQVHFIVLGIIVIFDANQNYEIRQRKPGKYQEVINGDGIQ